MSFIHDAFIQVFAKTFECEDHIIDLDTINKLSIVS